MLRSIFLSLAMSSIGFGALAQTGPTTGFEAPAPAPAPAPAAAPEEAPVPVPTQPLPDTIRAEFGDWTVVCAGDTDFCAMKSFGLNADGSRAVEMEVVKLAASTGAEAGVTVLTPLGVLLEEGVVYRIDDGEAVRRGYQVCTQVGCLSRYGATPAEVAALRAGGRLNLLVAAINVPQNPIAVQVSLRGFTAAFNSLRPQALN